MKFCSYFQEQVMKYHRINFMSKQKKYTYLLGTAIVFLSNLPGGYKEINVKLLFGNNHTQKENSIQKIKLNSCQMFYIVGKLDLNTQFELKWKQFTFFVPC